MATHTVRRIKDKRQSSIIDSGEDTGQSLRPQGMDRETRSFRILQSLIPPLKEANDKLNGKPSFTEQMGSIAKLRDANFVLIKKVNEEFENKCMKMNCAYDLFDDQDEKILFACETLFDTPGPDSSSSKCWKRECTFEVTVIGGDWDIAIRIVCNDKKTTIFSGTENIGQIKYTTIFTCQCLQSESYKIQDSNGKTTHLVKYAGLSLFGDYPSNFNIHDKKTGKVVGEIGSNWDYDDLPPRSNGFGLKFKYLVPLSSRILFLGALFTIIGRSGFHSFNNALTAELEFEKFVQAGSPLTY